MVTTLNSDPINFTKFSTVAQNESAGASWLETLYKSNNVSEPRALAQAIDLSGNGNGPDMQVSDLEVYDALGKACFNTVQLNKLYQQYLGDKAKALAE